MFCAVSTQPVHKTFNDESSTKLMEVILKYTVGTRYFCSLKLYALQHCNLRNVFVVNLCQSQDGKYLAASSLALLASA